MVSKSCAIQSIVENERKVLSESQALNKSELDELNDFLLNEALAEQNDDTNDFFKENLNVGFDKNIFNNFEDDGRKVKMIEFSKSGEFLFVLTGNKIKIFNCLEGKLVEVVDNYVIEDIKCVSNLLVR